MNKHRLHFRTEAIILYVLFLRLWLVINWDVRRETASRSCFTIAYSFKGRLLPTSGVQIYSRLRNLSPSGYCALLRPNYSFYLLQTKLFSMLMFVINVFFRSFYWIGQDCKKLKFYTFMIISIVKVYIDCRLRYIPTYAKRYLYACLY